MEQRGGLSGYGQEEFSWGKGGGEKDEKMKEGERWEGGRNGRNGN
jgi:hypothetical protein